MELMQGRGPWCGHGHSRRRGPAKKKDDAEDARICCLLGLDRHASLRPLIPHGELGVELRAIARDDERAARDQLRLLNRLRADLIVTFPAAVRLAATCAADLGSVTMLRLRAELVRAKTAGVRLAAAQLLALHAARQAWERRMGELLIGAARFNRHARRPQHPVPGVAPVPGPPTVFPGGDVYLSFPGLGDRLAARIAGEIGEDMESFETPNALQCYAGTAPVTRRSGKRDYVVAKRAAYNRYLGAAVHQWAFCSLSRSGWAREFDDAKIAAGKTCHGALRALSNRWLEVLWHCLTRGVLYDEAVHEANRRRLTARAA